MHDWPITRIPHVIDTAAFAPQDMGDTRKRLGLPDAAPLILFLASAGIHDQRKGFDFLEAALPAVKQNHPHVEVVVVGPISTGYRSPSGVPIHWSGSVSGDVALRDLYTACNVTAAPSREDNMPLTAMEAQTCGRAVVAFDIGGLPDIVSHHETGYLAPEGDIDLLALGLTQAISDSVGTNAWGTAARARAMKTWSPQRVVAQYLDLYERVLR
jgi:glycosyltransferase involved in cell wall biosynthesis